MRYFVHLAYSGKNYRGWQRQKQTSKTVQQVLEENFTKMLKEKVTLFGCGRTDAEVHASQYYAHFNYNGSFEFDPVFRLNKMLPVDISIYDIIEVDARNHAQYDPSGRTYKYLIHFKKDPFKAYTSVWIDDNDLNIKNMQEAVSFIAKQNDFASMCKKPDQYNSTLCDLMDFKMIHSDDGIEFTIKANRFLQSMVRLLVARVLEIGQDKFTLDQLNVCFTTNLPPKYPKAAHPQGLYLSKVEYPYI